MSQKVAGLSSDVVVEFFLIYLTLQLNYGPGVYSACNGKEYQEIFLWVYGAAVT
jgi:hypothetical protein